MWEQVWGGGRVQGYNRGQSEEEENVTGKESGGVYAFFLSNAIRPETGELQFVVSTHLQKSSICPTQCDGIHYWEDFCHQSKKKKKNSNSKQEAT